MGLIMKNGIQYPGNASSGGESSYTLPIASTETLGGIKIGENLSITEDGTLNVTGGGDGGASSVAAFEKIYETDTPESTIVLSKDYNEFDLFIFSGTAYTGLDHFGSFIFTKDDFTRSLNNSSYVLTACGALNTYMNFKIVDNTTLSKIEGACNVYSIYGIKFTTSGGSIMAENNDFMFLQNSGIKTNILVGENDKIEVEFDYVDYNNDECIFATDKSSAGNATIHLTMYGNKYYSSNGSIEFSFGSATAGKHTYIINDENNNCVFDGELVYNNFINNNVGFYYLLGSRGTLSNNVYNGKIYHFKVTDKTTSNVKADLVPITYIDKIIIIDNQQYEKKKSVLFDKISGEEYYMATWYSGND